MIKWHRYDERPLSKEQEVERREVGLSVPDYKLWAFVRDAGGEGVSWGSLPASVSQRLLSGGYLSVRMGCAWAVLP